MGDAFLFAFALRGSLGNLAGLVEEGGIFEGDVEGAFGAVEPELVALLGVVGHGGEDEAAAGGVGEDDLDVVVGLAAVVVAADGTGGKSGSWVGAEDPVGDVHVVGAELGDEAERPLIVEPPVDEAL